MNRRLLHLLFTGLLTAGLAAPAGAQDTAAPQDWVLTRLREQEALIATAPFNNGITVVARCSNNVFALILAGLPEVNGSEATRDLILLVGDETDERPYAWTVATDRTAAFSRVPALTARQLIRGGRLQIIVPAPPGGRRTRYVMNLRPSESAVQETLTRCGRPIVEPDDDSLSGDGKGLPDGLYWINVPRPDFPGSNVHRGMNGGSATLSCNIADGGRLTDCQVESEYPHGLNLGQAVRRTISAARVGQTDESREAGELFEGRRVLFTVNFVMAS